MRVLLAVMFFSVQAVASSLSIPPVAGVNGQALTPASVVTTGAITAGTTLSATGKINTADHYEIGGSTVLSTSNSNVYVGVTNPPGGATNNACVGRNACNTQDATGGTCSALGDGALQNSAGATYVVAVGWDAGINATGAGNVLIGKRAGDSINAGAHNTFIGEDVRGVNGESNKLRIGNLTAGNDHLIQGDFNVSSVTIAGTFAVGQTSFGDGSNGTKSVFGGVSVSSVSQCGTAALPVGNGTIGRVTTAGAAVATCSITWTPAYATGSVCFWQDISRNMTWSTAANGVASSTITFTGNWTAGDVIQYHCIGY